MNRRPALLLSIIVIALSLYSCSSSRESVEREAESTSSTSESSTPESEFESFSSFMTEPYTSDTGLVTLHFEDDDIYLEVPDSILGRDMLLVVRLSAVPEGFSNYLGSGSKINEMMVRWEKKGDRLVVRAPASTHIADDTLAVSISVKKNTFEPIIASFPILAQGASPNSWLIEFDDFLMEDAVPTSPFNQRSRKDFQIKRLDESLSLIDTVKSFPANIEARYVITFSAGNPPGRSRTGTMSFGVNQSWILLPNDPMEPRHYDPRVGWFTIRKIDYGTDDPQVSTRRIIRRWRLVPSDSAAYARGELVEPVKPITYYIDPATPEKWRPWFKKGIEDWQSAFETAGFKNAIVAMDPPSPEEDPDFSPEDARFSVVRWVAKETRNAVGPSVSDPRTGEILESDILFYHNHIRSYRNLYMIECGALDPAARQLNMPDSVIGEMLRAVVAHEIGHALGLPHNMGASYAYSIEELRSPSFTHENGIAASIMDYARLNYVAQPEDGDVRLIRKIGPYDRYAINWGYRVVPGATAADDERDFLDSLVMAHDGDPMYRYGRQQGWPVVDPRNQTEDVSNDAVEASRLGIENLKRVVPNLVEWTTQPDNDYGDLDELYRELHYHWYELMRHVVANIGGVYRTISLPNQDKPIFEPVPAARQREALQFLAEYAFEEPTWLVNPKVLDRYESSGTIDRIRGYQVAIVRGLLSPARLGRIIEWELRSDPGPGDAYTLLDHLRSVTDAVWHELNDGGSIGVMRRNLQRGYIETCGELMLEDPENEDDLDVDVSQSDIRSAVRGQLESLEQDIRRARSRFSDRMTRFHLDDALVRIDDILRPDK